YSTSTLLAAVLSACAARGVEAGPQSGYRVGSLAKDEPQAIYSADLEDPWNRIFYLLFTRNVKVWVSDDFADAAPFQSVYQPTSSKLSVSDRLLERIEGGDRAIEPFYPFGPPGGR